MWITPTALFVVLITWVAAAGPVFVVGEPYTNSTRPVESWATAPPPPAETPPPPPPPAGVEGQPSLVARWIILALLLIGILALVASLLRRWRERRLPEPGILAAPLHEAVSAVAAEQQDVLRSGAPQGAIIACWERLERAVADAGVPPLPWQTSAELTADVLKSLPVDPAAIDDLAALYREARFSAHTFDDAQRERALGALRRLHEDLTRSSAAARAAAAPVMLPPPTPSRGGPPSEAPSGRAGRSGGSQS